MRGGDVRVIAKRIYGPHYHSLTFDGGIAPAQPGQFVNVRIDDGGSILRRPFSVFRMHEGDQIEIVFDIRGSGTRRLAALRAGDEVNVLGPLGRGFVLPEHPSRCLLIGGGIGAAPLFFLAEELVRLGHHVDAIVGARSADLLLEADDMTALAHRCVLTTEDGSAGVRGRVTDAMPGAIDSCETDLVLACGPHPMLAAVTEIAGRDGVPAQVAVEELMACGWGVCMTCVMPVRTDPGQPGSSGYVRSCTEGPVFDGAEVAWEGVPASAVPVRSELVPSGAAVGAGPPSPEHELAPPGN